MNLSIIISNGIPKINRIYRVSTKCKQDLIDSLLTGCPVGLTTLVIKILFRFSAGCATTTN